LKSDDAFLNRLGVHSDLRQSELAILVFLVFWTTITIPSISSMNIDSTRGLEDSSPLNTAQAVPGGQLGETCLAPWRRARNNMLFTENMVVEWEFMGLGVFFQKHTMT